MDPVVAAILQSWTFSPWFILSLLLPAGFYLRGWWQCYNRMPQRFGVRHVMFFQAGLLALFLALASPLDVLADLLLQVHMIQHLVLMMIAPPLLWLGVPELPLLRGLPRVVLQQGMGPFLAWPFLQRVGHFLAHPVVCWLAFIVSNVLWHVPGLYELALRSAFWHEVQHVCFLGTGLLFWRPVIAPWPSRSRWPRWAMIPYLLLADIQNTALSAFLLFSERLLYPTYAAVPRLWGISALDDQAAAGVIMWVPGSVLFLVPAGLLAIRLLDPWRTRTARTITSASSSTTTDAGGARSLPPRDRLVADSALTDPTVRQLRLPVLVFLTVAGVLGGVQPTWSHHGGEVYLMEEAGPFLITVFTDPTPLRAGPVDISVMVQDRDRGRPILHAVVTVQLREHGTDRPPIITPALRQQATNKLLYAALIDLPTPGRWELQVHIEQGGVSAWVAGALTVAPPLSVFVSSWSSLLLLPVVIGLISLHQWLSQRQR
jgi:cytochrome c oxidase assembly factor CtaG